MAATGRYLYAIVDGDGPLDLGPVGLDGGRVYAVPGDGIAAVVSDVPDRKVRPERRKLAAHHAVLTRLAADRTVLPMAFGLIAADEAEVRDILARDREAFAGQLARVRGHVEMGVRLALTAEDVFAHFVRTEPELQALRDELFAGGADPGHEAKMELGRRFAEALAARRRRAADRVRAALAPAVAEVRENRPRSERELLNLAVLVPAGGVAAYEAAVAAAAAGFSDDYAFDLSGPWPPHNFVAPAPAA